MDCYVFLNKIPLLKYDGETYEEILESIHSLTRLTTEDYYLLRNGKLYTKYNELHHSNNGNIEILLKINGGKGGFGSMLRAIGAQIEKTTNKEACRDLSGRRLRDINEEKKLKAWLEKQKERDEEAKERKKRKLERLIAVPKHEFKDVNYENARSELTEKISEAVEEGFKKAGRGATKRKAESSVKRKPNLWFDNDLSSGSDTDSESDNECKKSKTSTEKGKTQDEDSAESSNSSSKNVANESNSNYSGSDSGPDVQEASCSNRKIMKEHILNN